MITQYISLFTLLWIIGNCANNNITVTHDKNENY